MYIVLILGAITLCFILFYRKRQMQMRYFENFGIPGPKPHWFMGNLLVPKNLFQHLGRWTKKYGKTYGYYQGPLPILVSSDLEFLRQISVKQWTSFHGRKELPLQPDPESEYGVNMVSAKGLRWKRLRSVINPTFSTGNLRQMCPIVNSKIENLITSMSVSANKGEPQEVKAIYQQFTMSVITDVAFGLKAHDKHFLRECLSFFALIDSKPLILTFITLFPELKRAIYHLVDLVSPTFIHLPEKWILKTFKEIIKERKRENVSMVKQYDMMYLMLNAVEEKSGDTTMTANDEDKASIQNNGVQNNNINGIKKTKKTLTDDEIAGQCFVFLLAGYETTSNTLTFLSYLLAVNKDKQDKLIEEIDQHYPNNNEKLTYDSVMRLEYLDMCIRETLRLYPIANSQFNRMCEENCTINGIHITKGTVVQPDVMSIHLDPEYWGPENPSFYVPERFTSENKAKMHPLQWLGFGAGPRNCVGMRLALMKTKLVIIEVLRHFTLEKCDRTEIPLDITENLTITSTNGVYIKIVPRKTIYTST